MSNTSPNNQHRLLTEITSDGIERWLSIMPGYDKRSAEPDKNYGVRGCGLLFVVKRGKVAVQWRIMTDWFLKSLRDEWRRTGDKPFGWPDGLGSIDYHSPVALYADQSCQFHDCEFTGGDCYFDGSCLGGSELFDQMCETGAAAVWKKLDKWLIDTEQRVAEQQSAARNLS